MTIPHSPHRPQWLPRCRPSGEAPQGVLLPRRVGHGRQHRARAREQLAGLRCYEVRLALGEGLIGRGGCNCGVVVHDEVEGDCAQVRQARLIRQGQQLGR